MDLVYICRDGENEELRYSIRSAVVNLPHDKLWVVGGKPDWYTGLHMEIPQDRAYYRNARTNLRGIIHNDQISDTFILMNDDFFIMNQVIELPYMYSGSLLYKIQTRQAVDYNSLYTNLLLKTYSEIKKINRHCDPLDYELHVPMIFEKSKLSPVIGLQGLWRSIYGNIFEVGGEQFIDKKIYAKDHPMNQTVIDLDSNYLSTEDKVFHEYKEWFNEKFPDPSIYEV